MDPVSLIAIGSMAATAIGGVVTSMGQAYQGQAQSNMYNYQASVAAMNQKVALQNADYERNLGEVKTQQAGLEAKAQQATLRAGAGASGVDVDTGSTAEVAESSQMLGQYKQDVVRSDAGRRAYGYEVEAANKSADTALYSMAATTAETSGNIKAAGSLISTAGSVADKWYTYRNAFGTT